MYVYVGKCHRSNLYFREFGNAYIEIWSVFKIFKKLKAFITCMLKGGGALMHVVLFMKGFRTFRAFEISLHLNTQNLCNQKLTNFRTPDFPIRQLGV